MERICEDCGERIEEAVECCPKCGLSLSGAKVPDCEVKNDYDLLYFKKFDELKQRMNSGAGDKFAVDEYVAEIQYKADCGDDKAQFFIWATQCDESRDPKRAYDLLSESAAAGNHWAEFALGSMYERGAYVKKDEDSATRLFRRAAMGGVPLAMCEMGDRYLFGICVKLDVGKAVRSYEMALSRGLTDAAVQLALIYTDESLGMLDHKKAFLNARIGADNGNARGKMLLGRMYLQGKGVVKDVVSGWMWCRSAADDGLPEALRLMGLAYEYGIGGVCVDRGEAVKWYEKAAASGVHDVKVVLAMHYDQGLGCEENPSRAYYYAISALDAGCEDATILVSRHFRTGRGVKQDVKKADCYLERALNARGRLVWRPCPIKIAFSELPVRIKWAVDDIGRLEKLYSWWESCCYESQLDGPSKDACDAVIAPIKCALEKARRDGRGEVKAVNAGIKDVAGPASQPVATEASSVQDSDISRGFAFLRLVLMVVLIIGILALIHEFCGPY